MTEITAKTAPGRGLSQWLFNPFRFIAGMKALLGGLAAIMLAAFNHAQKSHGLEHRLKGLKKPPFRPRLHSFTADDEVALYGALDEVFGDFLFAAIHTGLRPFCELARMTAEMAVIRLYDAWPGFAESS